MYVDRARRAGMSPDTPRGFVTAVGESIGMHGWQAYVDPQAGTIDFHLSHRAGLDH